MQTIFYGLGSLCCLTWLIFSFAKNWPYDDTDHKETMKVSGLILYTDYGTGVQYAGTPWGGLTMREGQTLKEIEGRKRK